MERNGSFASIAVLFLVLGAAASHAQERDPIAFVGHGAFFDSGGKQVAPTPDFVARAQTFYRAKLLATLPQDKKSQFARFQKQLADEVPANGQAKLVVDQRALDWLAANVDRTAVDAETIGKIGALRYVLEFQLPDNPDPPELPGEE